MRLLIQITISAAIILSVSAVSAQIDTSASITETLSGSVQADSTGMVLDSSQSHEAVAPDANMPDSAQMRSKQASADSLRQNIFPARASDADTTDSLGRMLLRDSLFERRARQYQLYTHYPSSIDSVFSIDAVYPFHIYSTDASGISEILGAHPALISIPYSLSSSMNRLCFFGLPSGHALLSDHLDAPALGFNQSAGSDIVNAADISQAVVQPSGTISYSQQSKELVNPHVLMWWESGLFDANALNVRFARPLGRHVQIAAFSNFRYFQREDYSQTTGGIYGFYNDFMDDSSMIVRDGRNPLVQEHVSSGRVSWHGDGDASAWTLYEYSDLHNDISYEYNDTARAWLRWEERSLYAHRISAGVNNLTFGKLGMHAHAFARGDVSRTAPVADSVAFIPLLERGESSLLGAGVTPYISLWDDTTAVRYSFIKDKKQRYDGAWWSVVEHRVMLAHIRPWQIGASAGDISAAAGYDGANAEDSLQHTFLYNVKLSAGLAGQHLALFTLQDRMPREIPFDTLFCPTPDYLYDIYRMTGAHCRLSYKKAGLYIGALLVDEIRDVTLQSFWPHGVLPYTEPGRVLIASPLFGRWNGLAVSSSWMLSDTRPYVKSSSQVSYHSPGINNNQRLFVNTGLEYWGERDALDYAGISVWNRPFYDLNTKISVQIKTFRLFFKINNILNRKFAYVPGYFMPGLTFRWGFNWLLQG